MNVSVNVNVSVDENVSANVSSSQSRRGVHLRARRCIEIGEIRGDVRERARAFPKAEEVDLVAEPGVKRNVSVDVNVSVGVHVRRECGCERWV